jgi:hypothetical protein
MLCTKREHGTTILCNQLENWTMHMDPNNMIKYFTMMHVVPLQITTKYISTSKIYQTYIYKCEYHYIELGSISMTFKMVLVQWLISYQEWIVVHLFLFLLLEKQNSKRNLSYIKVWLYEEINVVSYC